MIKAIETSYKSYRFRSRLEARWAVFFDEMGVQWEYEKEGYDLGEHGWYLPDFYLPATESFVEVKPKPTSFNPNQRIYLAGKFTGGTGKNTPYDWREGLIPFKKFGYSDVSELPTRAWEASYCGFWYAGPFPIDLVSGHASNIGHIEDSPCEDDDGYDLYSLRDTASVKNGKAVKSAHLRFEPERLGVMQKCLAQIDSSDVVFAWIEGCDCYGTLAEIGYAKAKGKQVIVGVYDKFAGGELWFAQAMADICVSAKDVEEAFANVFPLSDEEKKAKELARQIRLDGNGRYSWKKKGIVGIVYGDPFDHSLSLFRGDSFMRHCDDIRWGEDPGIPGIGLFIPNYTQSGFERAAFASRSARFEHGETPYVK